MENRLRGKKPGDSGTTNEDWEMLSNMKKDLGLSVPYKTATETREQERAAAAGWDPNDPKWKRPIVPFPF